MQLRPVDLRDQREERGVSGPELRTKLAHPVVGDAAVEHGQAATARKPQEGGRNGHADRQPEQQADRASADDRFSRGQLFALAELNTPGVVLDH